MPSSEGLTEAVALLGYWASRFVAQVCNSAAVIVFFAFFSKWSNCQIPRQEGRIIAARQRIAAATNTTESFIRGQAIRVALLKQGNYALFRLTERVETTRLAGGRRW